MHMLPVLVVGKSGSTSNFMSTGDHPMPDKPSCTCGGTKFGWPHGVDCPLRLKKPPADHEWATWDGNRHSKTCDLCGFEYTAKAMDGGFKPPPCPGEKP